MKKVIKILSVIFILTTLIACSKSSTDEVEIEIGNSNKFSREEIVSAVEVVKENFSFPGAKLKKLSYDEEESNKNVEMYMSNGKGSVKDIDPNDVIVILTDFEVDESGDNPVLSPGEYQDYNWILIRDKDSKKWTIDDQGY